LMHGSLDGSGAATAPRGCPGCTPSARRLHPVPGAGCNRRTPPGELSTASPPVATGCGDCTPSAWPSAPGCPVAASLTPSPGHWRSRTATAAASRSCRARLRFRSQPCGRRSARLIRAATMPGSHGEMMPRPPAGPGRCEPSAPTARCSGPAWPPTGTRPCRPARRGWPGRRARTCTRWTAARPRPAGTGARCSAQEIASTLTGHRSPGVVLRRGPPGHLSQFLSHSPPSAAVHQRPPQSCSGRSRTVADCGERWPALLESVLPPMTILSAAQRRCRS
jgi:hypothetical protein